ncbi:lipoate--protein ligase family protein [Vagococcus zengguangii]|uniref:Octanoyl-[GcvH]:protein N-octanoyltransferase n=1 Tax=Vagococcus zengguangii TaxID=2571750 RepID=A0A4D7CRW2_9ENTE|nr:lipoate--protein ligase family protein [Vagococcus zengguangii]QCI86848.1 lipoate--protein ligase family protein [Vagococcus zengguangii]TLG80454.1 lipoate--protein ligase family protein [Vagococcus zengguangii]
MLSNYYQFLSTLFPLCYDQVVIASENQFTPFAYTDMLTSQMTKTSQPVLHFWQLEQSVILGMKDSRVPHFKPALTELASQGYHVMLRNSGGLGIVADKGILNISFIIPNPEIASLSISDAYQLVMSIIQTAFSDFPQVVEAKEIIDSYCPGDYDLSIHNRKFAGIAQRRIKEGISVMIYLSVNGNQAKRGQLMRQFYTTGLAEQFGTNGYPPVKPESMANLEELLDTTLTISEVKERVTSAYAKLFTTPLTILTDEALTGNIETQQALARQIERMSDRNEVITDSLGGSNGNTL